MEYVYKSSEERVYADRGLVVNFCDVVDWPDGPPADGHWATVEEMQAELDRRAAERAEAEAAAADEQKKTDETPPPGGEQPSGDTGPTDTTTTPASARGRKPKEQ